MDLEFVVVRQQASQYKWFGCAKWILELVDELRDG
jgi:hypothetical protein